MSNGSECWTMKKVDTRRMQAAEMRMIRMMCGKTLRDGIRMACWEIEQEWKIQGIIWESRLRWLGHLERMDEINLVKRVREKRVPGHNERKAEEIMGWGDERGYEKERLVHQWCPR